METKNRKVQEEQTIKVRNDALCFKTRRDKLKAQRDQVRACDRACVSSNVIIQNPVEKKM